MSNNDNVDLPTTNLQISINSDDLIDTSILGKKELKLLIETKNDTIEYKF